VLRYFRFSILDFGFQSQIANLKLASRLMLVISIVQAMLLVSTASASLQAANEGIESQKAGGSEDRLSGFPVFSDADVPPAGEDSHIFYLLLGERMFRSREFTGARAAFQKVLELDSQDAQAHYFLGLIEYEEGNIEKAKTRFRIAHECISKLMGSWAYGPISQPTHEPSFLKKSLSKNFAQAFSKGLPIRILPDTKQVQLEFPNEYEARIYYKDGWYVKSKKEAQVPITPGLTGGYKPISPLTLEADSAYRIELKPGRKEAWARRGVIGLIMVISFLLAR